MKKFLLIFILFFLGACSENDFPSVSELNSLRILGIKANTPELNNSGGTVQLTPIIADPNGGGRNLTLSLTHCLDTGISQGLLTDCPAGSPSTSSQIDVASLSPGAQLFSASDYVGALAAFSINVPAGLLTGRSEQDQFNGVSYIVLLTLSSADGSEVTKAFKRIIITSRTELNQNPQIGDILIDNNNPSNFPVSAVSLITQTGADQAESYLLKDGDNKTLSRTEKIQIAWYANQGSLSLGKTDISQSTIWKPGESPSVTNKKATIIALLFDLRGGVDFKKISFDP